MFLEHHISIFVIISERSQDWSNDDALHFKITFFLILHNIPFFSIVLLYALVSIRGFFKKNKTKKKTFI